MSYGAEVEYNRWPDMQALSSYHLDSILSFSLQRRLYLAHSF
jgi:hypothetical protein